MLGIIAYGSLINPQETAGLGAGQGGFMSFNLSRILIVGIPR
jgi:hypothetical protein